MKKSLTLCFFTLIIFSFSSTYGRTTPSPGGFGISAEWLYMLPSSDDLYFVVAGFSPGSSINNTRRIRNDLTWHSGYRVELDYAFCDCNNDIRIRWTQFPSFSDSKTVRGENLHPLNVLSPLTTASEVSVKDAFEFHYLEALLGLKMINYCVFTLTLQGGIQYASLQFKEDDLIIFDQGQLTSTSHYESFLWGIGPEIGAYFDYCFSNCYHLIARGFTSLLISNREAKSSFFTASSEPGNFFAIKNTDYWTLIPLVNIRLGFNFSSPFKLSCFSCLEYINLDIEIGYEATWVFNGIDRLVGDPQNLTGFDRFSTFSLHGPYVHMGVSY